MPTATLNRPDEASIDTARRSRAGNWRPTATRTCTRDFFRGAGVPRANVRERSSRQDWRGVLRVEGSEVVTSRWLQLPRNRVLTCIHTARGEAMSTKLNDVPQFQGACGSNSPDSSRHIAYEKESPIEVER